MAYEIPGFSFPLVAAVDLDAYLFRGVTTNGSGKVILPVAGASIIGALNNKPKANEAATIVASGIVQLCAGAAITLNSTGVTPVKVTAAGKVIPLGASGLCVGYALEAAAADGNIIAVFLVPTPPVAA